MKTRLLLLSLVLAMQSEGVVTIPPRPLYGISVNPSNLQRAADWQQWTGKTTAVIGDATSADTWAGLTGTNPDAGTGVTIKRHKPGPNDPPNPMAGTNYILELAVPMFPLFDTNGTPFSAIPDRFTRGAAGNYNSYWQSFAQSLVAKGLGNTIIRLGWEFNIEQSGGGLWAIGKSNSSTMSSFAAYWKKVHDVMMAVPGANLNGHGAFCFKETRQQILTI